jgi:hypothetical protein
MGRKMTRLKEILPIAMQKALYRELRYVQALRVKCVSKVPVFEALWDMSEVTCLMCMAHKLSVTYNKQQ